MAEPDRNRSEDGNGCKQNAGGVTPGTRANRGGDHHPRETREGKG